LITYLLTPSRRAGVPIVLTAPGVCAGVALGLASPRRRHRDGHRRLPGSGRRRRWGCVLARRLAPCTEV